MKILFLLLAASSLLHFPQARADRGHNPQQVMGVDLSACPRPGWPVAALLQRASGKTTVEVQIGEDGRVADARIAVSSGRTDLDNAALAGIRRCVFHAVLAAGHSPSAWLKTQYVWVPSAAKVTEVQNQALFNDTKALADAGDAVAQNRLGAWYENGTYGTADLVQAAAWYQRAATNGNAVAQNNLGVLYNRGAGVPLDQKRAVYWYQKAAEQGHGWAQANLAWAYQHGSAGETDMDKALHWLKKSADGGLAAAQARLGLVAMQRATSDAERSDATSWFAKAAAQDNPVGIYNLGRSFELGLGNAQDDVQAAALYRKALVRSQGRAETALGVMLEAGRADSAGQGDAAALYQKAMRSGYPAAFYRYGLVLEQRRDINLATAVFRQGAELGDCDATVKYVQLRQMQGAAPAVDATTAAQWDQRAATCAARAANPLAF